jgi:hypothetical protein
MQDSWNLMMIQPMVMPPITHTKLMRVAAGVMQPQRQRGPQATGSACVRAKGQ